ncbi:MAG: SPOR domain-containing protein [Nitrospinae bacterium]|nr:SPOR domain-containing protein [Nitrospinota bacterium]
MKTRQKIIIGGLGALTPVVMNFLVIDINVLFVNLTLLASIGYAIRVVILFYLGGIVAYLHKDENSPVKLFELGIVAPAIITALLNGTKIEAPKADVKHGETTTVSAILIPKVYAQAVRKDEIKTFSLPKETSTQQIWRGLTGSSPNNVWFVIVGSHLKMEDAKKQAQLIAKEWKDFKAEVYAPYGENLYYAVVIGANLAREEAQQLRQKAILAGFPEDTYLWTFPK